MDATLIAMRYRGAGSRRQPKRPSSDARPDAAAWNDGSRGYGQEDAYPAAGEYDGYDGYAPGGSQPGYGGYGYPQGGGFNRSGGYPTRAEGHGTPSGGYPATGNGADPQDVAGRYAG